jgi:hypothetical protein
MPTTVLNEVVDLIGAVIWPMTLLAVFLAYRNHLPRLIDGLSRRVSGVSLGSFSVSFAVATEVSPRVWDSLKYLTDPLAMEAVPDSGQALFQLIGSGTRADSARIDLGSGTEWLTSRLYIFSIILSNVLGVRCLVFTETLGGLPRRFVGLSDPVAVRSTLERRFDWFQRAFTRGRLDLSQDLYGERLAQIKRLIRRGKLQDWELAAKIQSVVGSAARLADLSEPGAAENTAQRFLHDDLIRRERPADLPAERGWVPLRRIEEGGMREEHANWIEGGAHLESILGEALRTPYVLEAPGTTVRDLQRQAVLQDGPFVAVLDGEGRFKRLLNRGAIVEQLSREIAERGAATSG